MSEHVTDVCFHVRRGGFLPCTQRSPMIFPDGVTGSFLCLAPLALTLTSSVCLFYHETDQHGIAADGSQG